MRLTAAQLAEYEANGFIVLRDAFHDLAQLTDDFVGAYQALTQGKEPNLEGKGNKHLTRAQVPGSYWSELDHSLPALRIVLHGDVVSLARQLIGVDGGSQDIYLRNAGVNEMPPGRTVKWHRDSLNYFHAGEDSWSEFMHYPHADGQGTNPKLNPRDAKYRVVGSEVPRSPRRRA